MAWWMRASGWCAVGWWFVSVAGPASADGGRDSGDASEARVPRALVAHPFAVGLAPGRVARLTVRGTALDAVVGARLDPPVEGVRARIAPPGGEHSAADGASDAVGGTAVGIVLEFAADAPAPDKPVTTRLVLRQDGGAETSCRLRVFASGLVETERAGRSGLSDAPEIRMPSVVAGAIERDRDTDAFRIAGRPGVPFRVTVEGPSAGSLIDPVLVVYDGRMRPVARLGGTASSRADRSIVIRRPSGDGSYVILIADAGDRGGPGYPYLLLVEPLGDESGTAAPP